MSTIMAETKEGGKKKPEVEYVSGYGQHIFTFNGKKIYFNQFVQESVIVGWEKKNLDIEIIHLSTFGNDPTVLKEFVQACIDYNVKQEEGKIAIYELIYGDWIRSSVKIPRTLESVILDGNLADEIVADIKMFLNSA